jgi:predicted outer membrane repeat protein
MGASPMPPLREGLGMKNILLRPFKRRPLSQRLRRSPRPLLDALEPRLLFNAYTVSSTADTTTGGTLRQAILNANDNLGADTIVFDSSFYASPHTIVIDSAPPQINQQLTITGPGSSLLTIQRSVSGLTSSRQSFNSFATVLSLSGMTVTGGTIVGAGGGLSAVGTGPNITLDDMVFTGNSANGLGGAIYLGNNASLTIRNSTITGNTALSGGGIYFNNGGSLVMENCSITGNSATSPSSGTGGGLYFDAAALATPPAGFTPNTLVIRDSTFSGNTSAGMGGAIHLDTLTGTLDLQNSTLSGNTAAFSGGGISAASAAGSLLIQDCTITQNTANGTNSANGGGGIFRGSILNNTLTLTNSIVSGNYSPVAPDIKTDSLTTTHANFSAIGSATGFTLAAGGNNLPFGANLKLAPLASNGGPTQTFAILAGSPLINAGSNAAIPGALTTDQRGQNYPRIVDGTVDIGAFEGPALAPAVVSARFNYLTAPQSLQITFNKNVAASLSASDLVLKNQTTSLTIPAAKLALGYDTNTNIASFILFGYPAGALPDGIYHASIAAADVSDASQNHLTIDFNFDFFILAGDADHDGKVAFSDLVAVAQHYGASTGVNYAAGDFNYDGQVTFADLVTVAQNYGKSLPVPAPVPADKPLFSTLPIAKPAAAKAKPIIAAKHR